VGTVKGIRLNAFSFQVFDDSSVVWREVVHGVYPRAQ